MNVKDERYKNERYENGKIYTIRSIIDPMIIYVGSTIASLNYKLAKHKTNCKNFKFCNYKTNKLYRIVRDTNWSNYYIELFEYYPCNNLKKLRKRELEITKMISNLNITINGRNQREWYDKTGNWYETFDDWYMATNFLMDEYDLTVEQLIKMQLSSLDSTILIPY